jgi:LacI family transcriptional regulator, repressor for deo operon, udp, cdd, tsx, nupC, and nupG
VFEFEKIWENYFPVSVKLQGALCHLLKNEKRMKDLPSITTVAQMAGVSIATVSRVLNNSKPVGTETRQRVEEAVAKLSYRANVFGRSLANARSQLILVLVPDFANPFYAQIVQGVGAVAHLHGYKMLLADPSGSAMAHNVALGALYDRLADGVISLAHLDESPAVLDELRQLPWVACSEFVPQSGVPYVSIDHRQAAQDAVQYLLNRGHRRIALITADESYRWAGQRHEGYALALKGAGIEIESELIRTATGTDYAQGAQAAGGLLTLREPPTAVFAISDTLAIGAIKAFRRAGKRVPDDIAVLGFDNVPLAEVFEPSLTTIGQPMRELGSAAAELLIERMAGGTPVSRTLAHTLIVRESA